MNKPVMPYKFATIVLTVELSETIDTSDKEALLFDDVKSTTERMSEFVDQVFSVQVTPTVPPRSAA